MIGPKAYSMADAVATMTGATQPPTMPEAA